MNEHVGFIVCPQCKAAWHDGQLACSYCGSMEVPPAIKPFGPAWMWILIVAAIMLGALIDYQHGSHVQHFLGEWFSSRK